MEYIGVLYISFMSCKSNVFALQVNCRCISFGVRVSAICFLAMYHPTANDDLIVAVWLCCRDAITPQSGSGHAELLRREVVKDGGDRTEIMVVVVAKANVIYGYSVHYGFMLKSNHSLGELNAAFFTWR